LHLILEGRVGDVATLRIGDDQVRDGHIGDGQMRGDRASDGRIYT
jgi:hypothetical protein